MELSKLFNVANYTNEKGMLFNKDCMDLMKNIEESAIDLVLTDIPYNEVNRQSNGLRNLDKGSADILTFDLKSFLPLISMFNKGGGVDLSNIVGLLNNSNNSQTQSLQNGNNTNPMALISNLLSNKDAMGGILNLFKGGGLNLFNKKTQAKKDLKTTDFEIKNYTRVE